MRALAGLALLLFACATPRQVQSPKAEPEYSGPPEGESVHDASLLARAAEVLGCDPTSIDLRAWNQRVRAVGCGRYMLFRDASDTNKRQVGKAHPVGEQPPTPFVKGMTRVELQGAVPPLTYPREALDHHVAGEWIGQCVIGTDGAVRDCDTIQPLPDMDDSILNNLQQRHYAPATLDGRPVAVMYVFHIRLK